LVQIVDAYCTLGTERETALNPADLLRLMDQAGIDRAIVAPEDREIAVENASGNRRVVGLVSECENRLIPACTANPWYGRQACEELRRAVADGGRLLVLAPALQGFLLTDELADPLLEEAGRLRVPVYVHTGPHSSASPTQLVLMAERHPAVRFILGHCGSTDYHHDMPAVFRAAPKNVWFELSLVRPWAAAGYAGLTDPSRLIFGSAAPRNHPAYELRHLSQYLPVADNPLIYGENIIRLLEGTAS